jgi:hypothetical protein
MRHSHPEIDEWLTSLDFDAKPFAAMDKVRDEALGSLENSALAGRAVFKTRELNEPERTYEPEPGPSASPGETNSSPLAEPRSPRPRFDEPPPRSPRPPNTLRSMFRTRIRSRPIAA